jgi:hypothetical protein
MSYAMPRSQNQKKKTPKPNSLSASLSPMMRRFAMQKQNKDYAEKQKTKRH